MKYILLIEELPSETLFDTGINFVGFEEISYRSSAPFDDRATVNYDDEELTKWKNSIHALITESPLGKVQVTVIRAEPRNTSNDEAQLPQAHFSDLQIKLPVKIPREGLTIVRAPKAEGIKEYIVSYLHVSLNDEVKLDQEIFELEADKANIAFSAPVTGKVVDIYVKLGATIKPGDAILAIDKQDSVP